jgi:hypothetical protein
MTDSDLTKTEYTIFMLVKTTTDWLALSPEERFGFLATVIEPLLHRFPTVRMQFYDTEFFNSAVSDVIVWETSDLGAYCALIENLRETQFWDRYFTITSILPGIRNAYAARYDVTPVGA